LETVPKIIENMRLIRLKISNDLETVPKIIENMRLIRLNLPRTNPVLIPY